MMKSNRETNISNRSPVLRVSFVVLLLRLLLNMPIRDYQLCINHGIKSLSPVNHKVVSNDRFRYVLYFVNYYVHNVNGDCSDATTNPSNQNQLSR